MSSLLDVRLKLPYPPLSTVERTVPHCSFANNRREITMARQHGVPTSVALPLCTICGKNLESSKACADLQCRIFQEFRDTVLIEYRRALHALSSSTGGTALEKKFLDCKTAAELSGHLEWVVKTFLNAPRERFARIDLNILAKHCDHFQVAAQHASLKEALRAFVPRLMELQGFRHNVVRAQLNTAREPNDLVAILQDVAEHLENSVPFGNRVQLLLKEAERFAASQQESPPASAAQNTLPHDANRVA